MDFVLTEVEARVLGALMEKESTTPDYYPLSLNALVNACNQKNNREPVMDLDEQQVREALDGLGRLGLGGPARGADSRVTKYEHRMERFNLTRGEHAILCVLLLRGPQTPGELRGRTERIHAFGDLDEVMFTLKRLTERQPAMVAVLPRQPGTKEARYAQLLSANQQDALGAPQFGVNAEPAAPATASGSTLIDRIEKLERELSTLRAEFESFKTRF